MKPKRVRKNGQAWPNNIGPWIERLPTEQRAQLFQRAAQAQWGPKKTDPKKADDGPWVWPIDLDRYDRSSRLTAVETDILTRYAEAYRFYRYGRTMDFGQALDRLVKPLNDTLDYTGIRTYFRKYVLLFFLREMAERRRSFWGWTTDEWIETIERQKKTEYQHVIAVAYLLCGFSDLHRLSKNHIVYVVLARKVFGGEYMKVVGDRVQSLLCEWGYMRKGTAALVLRTIFEALLYKRSPHLDELKIEDLQEVIARRPPRTGSYCAVALSRVWPVWAPFPKRWRLSGRFKIKSCRLRLPLVFLPSGVDSAVYGLTKLRIRCATGTRAITSSSTSAGGSARCIQRLLPPPIGPGRWLRKLYPSSVSGMEAIGAASTRFM
jgi:hypothetical protein